MYSKICLRFKAVVQAPRNPVQKQCTTDAAARLVGQVFLSITTPKYSMDSDFKLRGQPQSVSASGRQHVWLGGKSMVCIPVQLRRKPSGPARSLPEDTSGTRAYCSPKNAFRNVASTPIGRMSLSSTDPSTRIWHPEHTQGAIVYATSHKNARPST